MASEQGEGNADDANVDGIEPPPPAGGCHNGVEEGDELTQRRRRTEEAAKWMAAIETCC